MFASTVSVGILTLGLITAPPPVEHPRESHAGVQLISSASHWSVPPTDGVGTLRALRPLANASNATTTTVTTTNATTAATTTNSTIDQIYAAVVWGVVITSVVIFSPVIFTYVVGVLAVMQVYGWLSGQSSAAAAAPASAGEKAAADSPDQTVGRAPKPATRGLATANRRSTHRGSPRPATAVERAAQNEPVEARDSGHRRIARSQAAAAPSGHVAPARRGGLAPHRVR